MKPVAMYEVQPLYSELLFKVGRHTEFTEGCVICCKSAFRCSTILQVEIRHLALLLKTGGVFLFGWSSCLFVFSLARASKTLFSFFYFLFNKSHCAKQGAKKNKA